MRDLVVLVLPLLVTVARLAGPGGARSVVAESVLVKDQLLILNRSRKRSSNLRSSDRGRRAVFPLHAPGSVDRFCDRLQAVNAFKSSSSAGWTWKS